MSTAEESPLIGEHPQPESRAFAMRFATVYLVRDYEDKRSLEELLRETVSALESDPSVTRAVAPYFEGGFSGFSTSYPGRPHLDTADLLERAHIHVVDFSDPIFFRAHVPLKNQRTFFTDDEAPTEEYVAYWDGETLLVAWDHDTDDDIPMAGGHVIPEILGRAAEAIGCEIHIQACNPLCDYVFMHNNIRVISSADTDHLSARMVDRVTLEIDAPASSGVEEAALDVWYEYSSVAGDFAPVKGLGRRVLDLERAAREELDELARLHHARAAASAGGSKERLKGTWANRGWRRRSRAKLATLWVLLGELEGAKRAWSDANWRYQESADERGIKEFFDRDERDDAYAVDTLDLSLIESAMQHAAGRVDTSALVMITLVAAIAGAIAGAVITLVT